MGLFIIRAKIRSNIYSKKLIGDINEKKANTVILIIVNTRRQFININITKENELKLVRKYKAPIPFFIE